MFPWALLFLAEPGCECPFQTLRDPRFVVDAVREYLIPDLFPPHLRARYFYDRSYNQLASILGQIFQVPTGVSSGPGEPTARVPQSVWNQLFERGAEKTVERFGEMLFSEMPGAAGAQAAQAEQPAQGEQANQDAQGAASRGTAWYPSVNQEIAQTRRT